MTSLSVPTRTPGSRYLVRQHWPDLGWQVVQVPEDQGRALFDRGELVYASSAQAHAVAGRLNKKRRKHV